MTLQFESRLSQLFSMASPLKAPAAFGPDSAQDVRRWLLRHEGGGWLQCDDAERITAAKRMIFIRMLVLDGTVSDGDR